MATWSAAQGLSPGRHRNIALGTGRLVAAALRCSWRQDSTSSCLTLAELEAAAPRLLAAGAGSLAWWHLRRAMYARTGATHELQQAYRLHSLQSALHLRALTSVLETLESAQVEPLLAKGWAIARLYAEPGLRPCGDIDLCVRPDQHEAGAVALRGLAQYGASVDLHRGLSRSRGGQAFSLLNDRGLDELYGRADVLCLGDISVKALATEDHLRLLCLHTLSHGVRRPLWLCDIGAALEVRPPDFDWDCFLSGDPKRTDWAIRAIGLAHQLLDARLDDTPIAERARRLPRWMVPAVLRQWGEPYRPPSPLASFLRHPAGLRDELRHHWPNGIEATVTVRGPFNEWPRLPFQIGATAVRASWFAAEAMRARTARRGEAEPAKR